MTLTIVVQNLKVGGRPDGDGQPHRWPLLRERITATGPVDLLLLCEVAGWDRDGHDLLWRACADLDLDPVPLTPARSGNGTALLYRRSTVGRPVRTNTDYTGELLHGLATASFEVGLPAPLTVVPVHFTPFSADQAMIEANIAASRSYKYGPYVVLAGDVNYPPAWADSPAPDYAAMCPYNRGTRTRLPDGDVDLDAPPVPDRRVTRKLVQNGYVDVAWHLYQHTHDQALLERTGSDDRVDQAYVSQPLAPAVSDYRRLTSPDGASDHHGLTFHLNPAAADTSNVWIHR